MRDNVQEPEVHLKDYFWVVYKRRWTIAAFFTVVVAVVTVLTFTMVPVYRATTQVLIEKENPNIMDFKELYAIDTTNNDFYRTQYKILESRFIALKVIEKLHLSNGGEVASSSGGGQGGQGSLSEDSESVVNRFLRKLLIEPVKNTRLVKVHFMSNDPDLAARGANAIVEAYVEHNVESKIEAVHGATEYLRSKIDEQREKLEESESMLQQYKERYKIISLAEKENITVSKLAELNSEVLRAENERVERETRYRQARAIKDKPDMIESIPKVLSNAFVTSLKRDEANLSKQLSELLKKFGDKHPRIITLREKLKATRANLESEIKKVVKFLGNEYEVALAKEETLKKAFEELKEESQRLNKLSIAYGVLARDVETNKQMYDILLTRLKETGITGGIQSTNVRVVDKAVVPRKPVKPRKTLNILLSVLVGLFGGIGVAFFLEYLDSSVKTPDDLKRYVKVPYMGPVPSYEHELDGDSVEKALVTLNYPKSTSAEAYRGVRTAVVFSSSTEKRVKLLLITSSGPSEGKSLTASNLAVTMAQSNTRTLLIDADFRKPRIHRIFGIPREAGLSNILVEGTGLEDCIKRTDIPNLDIIPSGYIPPNPAELLGAESFVEILEILKQRYDKIVLDSPPVLAVTDSVVLGTKVDEVLMVVCAGKFSREAIRRAIEQLRDVGANVIGAIINNIKVGQESYYYYQYYYYYYGEEKSGKRRRPDKVKRKGPAYKDASSPVDV
jgi:capsular exopolysaccharide synthesis family protein